MSLVVATYNVLADSYIEPSYYPDTPAELLEPAHRWPALVARAAALDADVLCLQEVERPLLDALSAVLSPRGYGFEDARKTQHKPDGCTTFFRRATVTLASASRVVYPDGSGHVALLLDLEHEGHALTVANTHLKWDPPETPADEHRGVQQARALLDAIERDASRRSWVACGDFNAAPGSALVAHFERRGLRDPFAATDYTCNANRVAKKIDWLLATSDLDARARSLPAIDAATPLPSRSEPSDHLPLVASLTPRPR